MSKQQNGLKLAEVADQVATIADMVGYQTSLRSVAVNSISEDDIKEIVASQLEKAKAGDQRAINFVFSTVLGGSAPVTIKQTNVITDVEAAARIAKGA